jgi:hypothetical protein
MVLLLLIAITATSVVFPENAVLLLAIGLIGVLILLYQFVGLLRWADERNAIIHAASMSNALFLFQQVQALREQAGLPPLDTGSDSLASLLKN